MLVGVQDVGVVSVKELAHRRDDPSLVRAVDQQNRRVLQPVSSPRPKAQGRPSLGLLR